MKKSLFNEIEIPKEVEVEIDKTNVVVKGPKGENKKSFRVGSLDLKKQGDKIIIGYKKATKREKKMINTIAAHIKNMIKGVQEKFEYKLKICFSHFPFTVNVSGNKIEIKNFLGEKIPRTLQIPMGVEVKTDKEYVTIISSDKELAGKVASDFEKETKIKARDKRIFQDGLYIVNKAGREI
jgi:large subunit ribosomal protein L6